jgi:hypothetical protein
MCNSKNTEFLFEEGASAGIISEEYTVCKEDAAVEKDSDREEEGVEVDVSISEVGEKAAFEEAASAGISYLIGGQRWQGGGCG